MSFLYILKKRRTLLKRDVYNLDTWPTKETYTTDLQKGTKTSGKRPTKETYTRDLWKGPIHNRIDLQKRPRNQTYEGKETWVYVVTLRARQTHHRHKRRISIEKRPVKVFFVRHIYRERDLSSLFERDSTPSTTSKESYIYGNETHMNEKRPELTLWLYTINNDKKVVYLWKRDLVMRPT